MENELLLSSSSFCREETLRPVTDLGEDYTLFQLYDPPPPPEQSKNPFRIFFDQATFKFFQALLHSIQRVLEKTFFVQKRPKFAQREPELHFSDPKGALLWLPTKNDYF